MKIRVYHDFYGCDTGCCGHNIEIDGESQLRGFEFEHPYKKEEYKNFAIEFAKDFIKKKYPECFDTIDWDSVDYSDVSEH